MEYKDPHTGDFTEYCFECIEGSRPDSEEENLEDFLVPHTTEDYSDDEEDFFFLIEENEESEENP